MSNEEDNSADGAQAGATGDAQAGGQTQGDSAASTGASTGTGTEAGGEQQGTQEDPPEVADTNLAGPQVTDEHIEAIAMLCNDANAAYCASIGDFTYGAWADTPEAIRASARSGVVKHLENPGLTPEQSHAAWLEFKRADGYTYGPVRDEATKQHPCMVDYADLPQAQRSKDFIFRGVVHSAAKLFDLAG